VPAVLEAKVSASSVVIRLSPLSVYKVPRLTTAVGVEIFRTYLEDYEFANECVALATQWEEL
jgi:hypothetical protein